jgi:serine/threonine protein phosphatase PrpC
VAAAAFDGAPWTTWLERMDLAVMQDGEAGESTAVVGTVVGSRVVGASVGDSEAWIVGLDAVVRLTRDQSRERLGTGRARAVGFEGTLDEGSTLVVATDGLFRGAASADTIVRAIRDGADAVGLAEVARGASGRLYDDVGVVLIRPR